MPRCQLPHSVCLVVNSLTFDHTLGFRRRRHHPAAPAPHHRPTSTAPSLFYHRPHIHPLLCRPRLHHDDRLHHQDGRSRSLHHDGRHSSSTSSSSAAAFEGQARTHRNRRLRANPSRFRETLPSHVTKAGVSVRGRSMWFQDRVHTGSDLHHGGNC